MLYTLPPSSAICSHFNVFLKCFFLVSSHSLPIDQLIETLVYLYASVCLAISFFRRGLTVVLFVAPSHSPQSSTRQRSMPAWSAAALCFLEHSVNKSCTLLLLSVALVVVVVAVFHDIEIPKSNRQKQ